MLHLGPNPPADVTMEQLARLAAAADTLPPQIVRTVADALDAWRKLPEGRQHAMQLRSLLSAELAGAIERVDRLKLAERQQAQRTVAMLQAAGVALAERLARW